MKKRNFWLAGVSGLTVIVPTVAVVSCGGGGDKKEDTTKNQGQSIPKVETGENANSSNSALAEFAKKYPNAIDVSTKTIKEGAFKDAVLPDDFVLPDEIVKIDRDAFHGAKIPKGFKLPSELKEIGPWALATIEFSDSFVIPDKVEIIRDDAFRNSSLPKKVVIPKSVKSIEYAAFMTTFHDVQKPQLKDVPAVMDWHDNVYSVQKNIDFEILGDNVEIGRKAFSQSSINTFKFGLKPVFVGNLVFDCMTYEFAKTFSIPNDAEFKGTDDGKNVDVVSVFSTIRVESSKATGGKINPLSASTWDKSPLVPGAKLTNIN